MPYKFNDDKSKNKSSIDDNMLNSIINGTYEGRNIEQIPELQEEIADLGGVIPFLRHRSATTDSSNLNIWDYVEIEHSGDFGTRRYDIGAFWPDHYVYWDSINNIYKPSGGIVFVSHHLWPEKYKWSYGSNNNGYMRSSDSDYYKVCPYLASELKEKEDTIIAPSFPQEWINAMAWKQSPLEERDGRNGIQTTATGGGAQYWTMKAIWSPSEIEVFGHPALQTLTIDDDYDNLLMTRETQFPIFAQPKGRIRTDPTIVNADQRKFWWTRNVVGNPPSSTLAVAVGERGDPRGQVCSIQLYCLPCFEILPEEVS